MSQESLEIHLRAMTAKLCELDRIARVNSATQAPHFNPLNFVRSDENGLSVIVADLLKPTGSHGQGSLFLEAFFQQILLMDCPNLAGAWVETESATRLIENRLRRIDIRVRIPGWGVLGIENKLLDAVDQENQVRDYLRDLKNDAASVGENVCLIYLTRLKRQPPDENSSNSAERDQGPIKDPLLPIDAESLIIWLKACRKCCESVRVLQFLHDFIAFIETRLLGKSDMTQLDSIIRAATSSSDTLRTALQIASAAEDIKRAVLTRFFEQLSASIEADVNWNGHQGGERWKAIVDDDPMTKSNGIQLQPSEKSRYGIRVALDSAGGNCVNIGIASRNPKGEPDFASWRKDLENAFEYGDYAEPQWPWYTKFVTDGFGNDWGAHPAVMARLLETSETPLLAPLRTKLDEIRKKLISHNLLAALQGPPREY
jgi:hypothetical protein